MSTIPTRTDRTGSPQGTRVLIVDDAASLRALLCSLLRAEGFQVVADLDRGESVLATIERTSPQVVCLDYLLPDTDGLTLLGQIHQAHPSIAVVMITASDDTKLQAQAAEAGAAGFLHKPFTQQQIIHALRHVAHAQRLMAGISLPQALDSPLRGKRIVVADDSAVLRQLLVMIVTESGMRVVGEARNGAEAVELTRNLRPDLLCLDIEMPVMGGIEALHRVRAADPNLPVMMITARAERDTVREAARGGARGYILKPYQPERVVEALESLFSC